MMVGIEVWKIIQGPGLKRVTSHDCNCHYPLSSCNVLSISYAFAHLIVTNPYEVGAAIIVLERRKVRHRAFNPVTCLRSHS